MTNQTRPWPASISAGWLWIACGLMLAVNADGSPVWFPLLAAGLIGLGVGVLISPNERNP